MWNFVASIAKPVLTSLATNFLGNKLGGGGQPKQPTMGNMAQPNISQMPGMQFQMPQQQNIPLMSQHDAMQQAKGMVNPIFDQQLETTMKNMDRQNMQRGFYGQVPGDVLKNARALDVERARAGEIANMSHQMLNQNHQNVMTQQNRSQQLALSQQQMANQWGLAQQQLGMQQQGMNMQGGQNTWGNMMNLANLGMQGLGMYAQTQEDLPPFLRRLFGLEVLEGGKTPAQIKRDAALFTKDAGVTDGPYNYIK